MHFFFSFKLLNLIEYLYLNVSYSLNVGVKHVIRKFSVRGAALSFRFVAPVRPATIKRMTITEQPVSRKI